MSETSGQSAPVVESKECRICKESENADTMISPCQCAGSLKYVHKECLLSWIQTSGSIDKCNVCKKSYTCNLVVRREKLFAFLVKELRQMIPLFAVTLLVTLILLSSVVMLFRMDLSRYNALMAHHNRFRGQMRLGLTKREFHLFRAVLALENSLAAITLWVLMGYAVRDEWDKHKLYIIED